MATMARMGVFTDEIEHTTKIQPARLIGAFACAPTDIRNVELIEGDGGPGRIIKITFGEGSQVEYVKYKIESLFGGASSGFSSEAVDEKGLSFNYGLIEGDALMNNLEKISYEIKFMAGPEGGSICKISISNHFTIGDIYIKEEDVKAEKERALGLFKAVEAYLLANREACKMKVD
ncbi:hypothetical protein SLEP1_g57107 [Rubroshorea leprosula]|uniref:Bet v I/Major latex protein domain-containing protein n=1 Tax=Rubroshorea leprosula TaxID=152421 RepID=A0AAV5MKE2_9ROSI|nr:hypothetical protein SLEP1_g57107 [Rubroshorea leprosula]